MKELSRKVGKMEYDGLITDLTPDVQVNGRTIRKVSAEAEYKRGTVFAKSSVDNKLVILGTAAGNSETLTPDCILCDDIEVGTTEDVSVAIYTAGCFDPNKIIVADGYSLTEGDKDKLRERGIVFKAASAAE